MARKAERAVTVKAREAIAEQEAPSKEKRWYVIHTYSGYEDRVKKNLEHRVQTMDVKDRIFEVVVPTEDEI